MFGVALVNLSSELMTVNVHILECLKVHLLKLCIHFVKTKVIDLLAVASSLATPRTLEKELAGHFCAEQYILGLLVKYDYILFQLLHFADYKLISLNSLVILQIPETKSACQQVRC